ncbi:hypothetical protein P8H27_02070 [Pseudomonas sp. sp1636]|uniref:hypothetical protein n=1 Tax=Pseudomonas sp. sp1636 TaxID=3036707 RepID=UPI0025A66423|nr:hypothetical protein [Pseudomonas sp. sp1636]MDM8347684.1 hypothetical protein [Pseudomonas sp. sp1636]
MKIFKNLLLIGTFLPLPVMAEILHSKITIGGQTVEIQKLTIECPVYLVLNSGWQHVNREYTLHILNPKLINSNQWNSVKVENYGYYAWSNNTWNRFSSVEGNVFWLTDKEHIYIGTNSDSCISNTCTTTYDADVFIRFARRGIARNSLEMVYEHDGYSCKYLKGPGMSLYCAEYNDLKKWEIPQDRTQCKLTKYKRPPEKIGF